MSKILNALVQLGRRVPIGKYRWPVLAVAAGLGLYAAQHFLDQLPPNTDVAGLIVSALGLIAGMNGKGNAAIRADLDDHIAALKKIWQGGRDHQQLQQAVADNKAACDQVARDVINLGKHVAAHHGWIATYSPNYQAPDVPLPAG